MMMAGLDGVLNKIDPGEPLDKDIYDLSPEEMKNVPSMPASLEEALSCLEDDHAFLLKGDVFTEELIETFINYKRKNEADADPPASASVRVRAVLRHLVDFNSVEADRSRRSRLQRRRICNRPLMEPRPPGAVSPRVVHDRYCFTSQYFARGCAEAGDSGGGH